MAAASASDANREKKRPIERACGSVSSPSRRVVRRSDVGLSFFSCQDERLTAAETRASTAEARVSVLEEEKAQPFFSGLGGTRKSVLQAALMKELAAQACFPFLLFPPFLGFFPCQATRVAVLETELRGEKVWTQGFQARCWASFFSSFLPPVAPRQADARALRQELERLKAHPSSVEIDRPRFRVRGLPCRRRSGRVEDPRRRFPFFSEPSRSIPRRTVSPTRRTTLTRRKKRSGPRPFFPFFFSAERALRSWHLGVPSGHSAERALR